MLGRSRTLTLLLVVAALGAALVLKLALHRQHLAMTKKEPAVLWTLTREDRVMLIDLLDRIEEKDPSIHRDVEVARGLVLDDSRELVIGTTRLSSHFFDWDSLTQERVLLRAISHPSSITKKDR